MPSRSPHDAPPQSVRIGAPLANALKPAVGEILKTKQAASTKSLRFMICRCLT